MATPVEQKAPTVHEIDKEIARLSKVGVAGHFPFAVDAVNGWTWAREMKIRIDELTSHCPETGDPGAAGSAQLGQAVSGIPSE